MPRNSSNTRDREQNSSKKSSNSSRTRKSSTNSGRDMDNEFEDSRYESERYEDAERNYDNPRQARGMSPRRDEQNWDATANDKPWSYASSDRQSQQSLRGNRSSQQERAQRDGGIRGYSQSRPRNEFENQDYGMSYDQSARRSERDPYTQGGGYRGQSSQEYREPSHRTERAYSRNDRYSSERNDSWAQGDPRNGRDSRDSQTNFEPYSQGGRVYQDRYAQGPSRGQNGQDRDSESGGGQYSRTNDNYYNDDRNDYGHDIGRERSFSRGSLGAQDRYDERGTQNYRSQRPEFMGRDEDQDLHGGGRYGSRGASGSRQSNNNYLDESDDGYRYAYGSDAEDMTQSRRMGSDRGDFSNERTIAPGRARFSHGSEMQEDEEVSENFAPMDDAKTARGKGKDKKSPSGKMAKAGKTVKGKSSSDSKEVQAKSKAGKSGRKGTKADIDSRTTIDV